MIRSMTGFARRERQGPWGTLVCELRTVNHRYLEASLRLPEELKALDNEVRQAIARGAPPRQGRRQSVPEGGRGLRSARWSWTTRCSMNWSRASSRCARGCRNPAPVSPLELLRWPGVVREAELDVKPVLAAALELLREALDELNETRCAKGSEFASCCSPAALTMRDKCKPCACACRKSRSACAIASSSASRNSAPRPIRERLEQELVLYAHKMDVDEELDRLGGAPR